MSKGLNCVPCAGGGGNVSKTVFSSIQYSSVLYPDGYFKNVQALSRDGKSVSVSANLGMVIRLLCHSQAVHILHRNG